MKVSPEELKHVARLARMELPVEEEDKLARELSDILEYMEHLREVDTGNVEPLAHVAENTNAVRADVPGPTLPQELVLANAPERHGPYFEVPAAVDKEIDAPGRGGEDWGGRT